MFFFYFFNGCHPCLNLLDHLTFWFLFVWQLNYMWVEISCTIFSLNGTSPLADKFDGSTVFLVKDQNVFKKYTAITTFSSPDRYK
uniref:Uncharacterized protein n=1 Tax=Rhizophora mucronata TaxID=61149 RepID=A0A2P2QL36_RHIMU